MSDMNLTLIRDAQAESGKTIPKGEVVEYRGHLPGAAIRVRRQDGSEEIIHPLCTDKPSE